MTSSSFKKSDNIEKQLIAGSQNAHQTPDYQQELLEPVKTSNNYKSNKTTINQRIGEDFEPDKPIITYNKSVKQDDKQITQEENKTSSPKKQSRATAGEISD